jgi:uncharacterized protein YqhQ
MANSSTEKFKTTIGGQALIEGIMMRGPELDAIVVRKKGELVVETNPRKVHPKGSFATWPLIRGAVNFFDAQVTGVKALMRSADLSPEEMQDEPSKLDRWLEEKLGNEKFQKLIIGLAVAMGLGMSIALFFLLPMVIGSFFYRWVTSNIVRNLIEGIVRIVIFVIYIFAVSALFSRSNVGFLHFFDVLCDFFAIFAILKKVLKYASNLPAAKAAGRFRECRFRSGSPMSVCCLLYSIA